MASDERLWEALQGELVDFFRASEPSDRLVRDGVLLNCAIWGLGFLAIVASSSATFSVGALVASFAGVLGVLFFGFVAGTFSSAVTAVLLDAFFLRHATRPLER